MVEIIPLTAKQLETGLENIRQSPENQGVLEMIVRRPEIDRREVLTQGELNSTSGLVGDNWLSRVPASRLDNLSVRDSQITLMNSRVIALLAQDKKNWPLAGDQLFVDLDLSAANLPPGTRLLIGTSMIEVTDKPHTGCKKFAARFGQEALEFVNSPVGKQLHLRGINARIVQPGTIHVEDRIVKV